MATAFYTVRVENNYGEWMEFPYEYDFDLKEWDGEPFNPADISVQEEIYGDIMQNLYVDIDFERLEED